MRVLHFTQTLPGGPATFLNELLAFQAEAYTRVTLLCPAAQHRLIESGKTEVVPLADARRNPRGLLAMYRSLCKHVSANRYDVIHLHSSFAGAVGRLAPRRLGARVVYCAHGWAHGMDVAASQKLLYAASERLLATRADVIINISQSEQRRAAEVGIPSAKCKLIYNGVRDAAWTPLEARRRARRLLFVGRYDRQKGLDVLLQAMNGLATEGFSLTAIGSPVIGQPSVDHFPRSVRNLGWQNRAVIQREMAECDLVVVPSRWEGFGLVAIEAMRAGRAVVATNVGGLAEVVVDGETGILCPAASPDALQAAIVRAAPFARQAGIAGRARYEHLFTAERMFRQTHAAYVQ